MNVYIIHKSSTVASGSETPHGLTALGRFFFGVTVSDRRTTRAFPFRVLLGVSLSAFPGGACFTVERQTILHALVAVEILWSCSTTCTFFDYGHVFFLFHIATTQKGFRPFLANTVFSSAARFRCQAVLAGLGFISTHTFQSSTRILTYTP